MDVAVVGAGYAGLAATRRLERTLPDDFEIGLVDDTGIHEIQHELHRLIRYPDLAETLRIRVDTVVDRSRIYEATVEEIDARAPRIETRSGDCFSPEAMILALGARTADYGIAGVAEHGHTCKTIAAAERIRARVIDHSPTGQVLVVGAGLTGIQVAGEIAELMTAANNRPAVTIVEQESQVAPMLPAAFGDHVREALLDQGIDVRTGTTITGVTEDTAHTATGSDIPYDVLVWAGGITGPAPTNGHRLDVAANLRVAGRTFAAGDVAAVIDDHGHAVPAAAQTAVPQGRIAAENVGRLLLARTDDLVFEPRLRRYTYDSPGWLVSVGDEAVGFIGDQVVTGRPAALAKGAVGAGYLTSIGAIETAIGRVQQTVGLG